MHLYEELPMELGKIISPSRGAIFKGALNNSSEFCMKMPASIASTSWELEYIVRGYHIYKDKWDPYIGEALDFARKTTNPHYHFIIFLWQFSIASTKLLVAYQEQSLGCDPYLSIRVVLYTCPLLQSRNDQSRHRADWMYHVKSLLLVLRTLSRSARRLFIQRIMNGCAKYILRLSAFT